MNHRHLQTYPQQFETYSSVTAQPTTPFTVVVQQPTMAATYASGPNHHQQIYHQSLSVDTKHGQFGHDYFDEDNVLDEGVLDNSALDSGLEMSPHMVDSRRDSFAIGGPALISPATKAEDWHSSVEMQSLPSNNPFFEQSQQQNNNPFTQGAQFPMQPQAWAFNGEYAGNLMMPGQVSYPNHGNIFGHLAADHQNQGQGQGQNQQQQTQTPSPQEHEMANGHGRSTRPVSPTLRAKGNGIRKKNARCPIPENHTLATIDNMIAVETDDKKIKELKSHKRLLRNRQAALDSRQRKKQHTERLEDEKKQYSEVVSLQESEIDQLKQEMATMALERQQYAEYVHKLQMEKDEMIAAHTNEAGELRRKIAVLSDHVQRLESNPVNTTASNSNDFGFGNMHDVSMSAPWDHGQFINDFPVEAESKQDMAIVKKEPVENDKASSQQGGLLFMLFLVGAFVLSNKSPAPIPRVSDDVRAASATLLDNVLKDAGISSQASVQPIAPQPSGTWTDPATSIPMDDMTMDDSVLGQLGNTLTQPTQEQSNEQLFGLSAAQYNNVNADFVNNAQPQPSEFPSQGRRNLNDALAALRVSGSKAQGAADVYTRSLLWDQIPQEIVRDFAKMMQTQRPNHNNNHHPQPQHEQQQQQCSNDIS